MKFRFHLILAGLIFFSVARSETDVLLLKVDYTTHRFEGGQKLKLTQSPDPFTVRTEYKEPVDFGWVKVWSAETDDLLFYGDIFWMGCGKIIYPAEWLPANEFSHVMTEDYVIPVNGFENIFNNPWQGNPDFGSAWSAVQGIRAVRQMLEENPQQRVKLFFYTPSVGDGNPADWKWIIFLAGASQSISQNAHPFAPAGSEWHYSYTWGCCPENSFNYVVSEKDTLVEGDSCRILRHYYVEPAATGETYVIRQAGGKIYYYYQNQFNLLFDFDAKANDTVEFSFRYKMFYDPLAYDPQLPHKDTVLTARYRVESITENDRNLKTFRTEVLAEDKPRFQLWGAPHTYTYTEKIGWHDDFMPALDNAAHPDDGAFRMLRCYSEPGFLFVSDEWAALSLPCDYSAATGFDTPSKESSSAIYPNPFNDRLVVFASDEGTVEITDVSGKTVHYSRLSKGTNEISVSHLPGGIYPAKIRNRDNSVRVLKLIKL
jgi:hypothetical protein